MSHEVGTLTVSTLQGGKLNCREARGLPLSPWLVSNRARIQTCIFWLKKMSLNHCWYPVLILKGSSCRAWVYSQAVTTLTDGWGTHLEAHGHP